VNTSLFSSLALHFRSYAQSLIDLPLHLGRNGERISGIKENFGGHVAGQEMSTSKS
jgi:hypothetical protein